MQKEGKGISIRRSEQAVGNPTELRPTDSFRILKTNRTEYLILLDDGRDFEALYTEWCKIDDAFCDGELPESKWQDIATFLRKRQVTVIEPFGIHVLADYYGE